MTRYKRLRGRLIRRDRRFEAQRELTIQAFWEWSAEIDKNSFTSEYD